MKASTWHRDDRMINDKLYFFLRLRDGHEYIENCSVFLPAKNVQG